MKALCKITTILIVKSAILAHCPLVTQTVKNLPTVQEIWVQPLVQEYPLEKEMATHSSTLAWKTLWAEEPGRLQSMGSQESDMT
jgi:hypothetical protein